MENLSRFPVKMFYAVNINLGHNLNFELRHIVKHFNFKSCIRGYYVYKDI